MEAPIFLTRRLFRDVAILLLGIATGVGLIAFAAQNYAVMLAGVPAG